MRRISIGLALLGCSAMLCFAWTHAAERNPARPNASAIVREAVAHETAAMASERNELLDGLLADNPDHAPARWQRGFLKTKRGWSDVANLDDQALAPKEFDAYEAQRAKTLDDLAGNIKLAKWCAKHGMSESARGHWSRALDFDSDSTEARAALGHTRTDDGWATPEERAIVAAADAAGRAAALKWRTKVEQWVAALESGEEKKSLAEAKLRAIDDPAACPLLIAALSKRALDTAILLVEILDAMPELEATRALAEVGVMTDHDGVRLACAEALKKRNEHAFAPQLLAAMSSPITSKMTLEFDPQGRFLYRHSFAREMQNVKQVQNMNTEFVPTGDDEGEGAVLSVLSSVSMAARNEIEAARQNRIVDNINQRISSLLSATFDANHGKPEDWWNWWNDRQQALVQGPKQTQTRTSNQRIPIITSGGQQRSDCFVEGTPVWTARGAVAIEKMRSGDLVLAQDPVTGELAFKAVARPTERPVSDLFEVQVGADTLRCTGGHCFWATGQGWIKASDLKSGTMIRTATGSQLVADVQQREKAVTYNLVVVDFHTYFVGPEKTLCHDNTELRPTLALVPGVYPEGVVAPGKGK